MASLEKGGPSRQPCSQIFLAVRITLGIICTFFRWDLYQYVELEPLNLGIKNALLSVKSKRCRYHGYVWSEITVCKAAVIFRT